MARIQLPQNDVLNADHQVFVGYDSPMESFFGQVYDLTRDEDDRIIHWVGIGVSEITDVDALAVAMGEYCGITEMTRAELMADFNHRTTPSPLQRWGRDLGR